MLLSIFTYSDFESVSSHQIDTILVIIFWNFKMFQCRFNLSSSGCRLQVAGSSKTKLDIWYNKPDIKLFLSFSVLLDICILFQMFCPKLSEQASFWSQLRPVSFKLQFLDIFYNLKAFLQSLIKIQSGSVALKFQI